MGDAEPGEPTQSEAGHESPRARRGPLPPPEELRAVPFPFTDLDANRAWLATVCFAADLVRWFQLLCVTGHLACAEPKTLRWRLWHAPARLIRHARHDIDRLLDAGPTPTPSSPPTPAWPPSPEPTPNPSHRRITAAV